MQYYSMVHAAAIGMTAWVLGVGLCILCITPPSRCQALHAARPRVHLTALEVAAAVADHEQALDAMIQGNEAFGKWYFDKGLSMLPQDALESYSLKVENENNNMVRRAFQLKMTMRGNGWDDAYYENEPRRLKELAYSALGEHSRGNPPPHVAARAETDYMSIVPHDERDRYKEALRAREEYRALTS